MKMNNVKIDCRNDDGTINIELNKAFQELCCDTVVIDTEVNYAEFPYLYVTSGELSYGDSLFYFKDSPEREITMNRNGSEWDYQYVPFQCAVPQSELNDAVHQPKHYELMDGIESIEIIAASLTATEWRGFCLGSAVKYRLRAGKKDALQQDIDKANNFADNLFPSFKHLNRSDR